MTYYVYKAFRDRRSVTWVLSSQHDDLAAAEAAARALCPRKEPIHTEPGSGLDRGFFGSSLTTTWAAMITTKPEHT